MPNTRPPVSRDDPYGSPWQTPEEREARRKVRHARWLASLTDADWLKLGEAADRVSVSCPGIPVDGLDAPLRALVCEVGWEVHFNGERIGTLKGGKVAVLVWAKP